MALIPEHIISEIRDRADIVAIVGQHVKLRKAGLNHKGLCPFHQEKSPSFNVNAEKGFFYCFGCQKKGDVFTFMMELEGRSFVEAAESLAERLGIIIPTEIGEKTAASRGRRSDLLKASTLAKAFYRQALLSERGAPARAYLESRGIGSEISEAFGLGCAPDEWGALGDYLHKNGIAKAAAEAAGLLIPRKSGSGTYDRFRDRLMCPVATASGDCVGFSGRRLGSSDDEKAGAKYINSPESLIYKKSKLLFGLDLAREGFRARGRAILVEGNFDVVNMHQAGFTETVAPLGTALTEEQATRLKRLVDCVVLLFDGDDAGRAATLKSLQTLLKADLEVRIANLPKGVDPDDMLRQSGPEALTAVLDKSQPGVEFFIDNVWTLSGESAHGRAKALSEAAHVLKSISSDGQRDLQIGQFARILEMNERDLRRQLREVLMRERRRSSTSNTRANASASVENVPSVAQGTGTTGVPEKDPPRHELDILAILADHPSLVQEAKALDVFSLLTDSRVRDMYSAACEGQPILHESNNLSPSMARSMLGGKYATLESPTNTLQSMVATLTRAKQMQRLPELQREAQLARRRGDVERERTLVNEILTIRKQVD